MSFLTHMDLLAGLLMTVGTASLIMATARQPKGLSDEIAHRVETTIAVLDECGAGPRRR